MAEAKKPATKKPTTKPKTTSVRATKKSGRNQDGTYRKGHSGNPTGEGAGRPAECLSFREQVKLRAAKNPKLVTNAIDTLEKIASDPEHPKCIEAIDKLIKLNGNYDAQETKLTDNLPVYRESPLDSLTIEELRKLKALKQEVKK